MGYTRREAMKDLCSWPLYAAATRQLRRGAALPDKDLFPFTGVYLNAAYTHPMGRHASAAGEAHLASRLHDASRAWPGDNPRNAAVRMFAPLINANPSEIAVVPSTMEGENLVGAAVGLGPQAGVVTDALHYDASLAMYAAMHQLRGVPVAVAPVRHNRIELADMDRLIAANTRLVAVSLVSSATGFEHDLKALCALAHAKGALVYADIIQAAGAVPIDVKASGVDFCCCGTYKWLMGDFGTAFLYVRPDRLSTLQRVEFGWRQFGPGEKLGTSTISHFEVSTPAWGALAIAAASIGYVRDLGVETIQRHRQPLLDALQRELPKRGFTSMTPPESRGPTVAFSHPDAEARFSAKLKQAGVTITIGQNSIRVSPSVYNDMDDIERLLQVLR